MDIIIGVDAEDVLIESSEADEIVIANSAMFRTVPRLRVRSVGRPIFN
jgi:hypothetical protein